MTSEQAHIHAIELSRRFPGQWFFLRAEYTTLPDGKAGLNYTVIDNPGNPDYPHNAVIPDGLVMAVWHGCNHGMAQYREGVMAGIYSPPAAPSSSVCPVLTEGERESDFRQKCAESDARRHRSRSWRRRFARGRLGYLRMVRAVATVATSAKTSEGGAL